MNDREIADTIGATLDGFIMGLEQADELIRIWKRDGSTTDECLIKLRTYIETKKKEVQ